MRTENNKDAMDPKAVTLDQLYPKDRELTTEEFLALHDRWVREEFRRIIGVAYEAYDQLDDQ
jgi:hypothetical protein